MEMIDVTEKKELNWNELGFAYMETDFSFVCDYKDGAWGAGELTPDHTVTLSECAGILHYCQECFEGLKAYTTEDGYYVFEVYIVTDRYIYQAELRFLSSLMSQYSMYTSYLENSFVANELYQG